jgi:hypothetical protein
MWFAQSSGSCCVAPPWSSSPWSAWTSTSDRSPIKLMVMVLLWSILVVYCIVYSSILYMVLYYI